MNQMMPSDGRFDLVENAGEADGVVVGDVDVEGLHGDLERGGRDLAALDGCQVVGLDELAAAIQVVGQRQAMRKEGAIADFHAAVSIFLWLEFAPEGLAGGVVGG